MSGTESAVRQGVRAMTQLTALARDGVQLIEQEIQLARQESKEKLAPAARSTGMILGGGLLSVYGVGYLVQSVVRALATRMPAWLASLLLGGVLTGGGLLLAGLGGRNLRNLDIVPHKAINSLKEDKQWLQRQIRSRLR